MKKWYLGIDGGGTKTAFSLSDREGNVLSSLQCSGCSHTDIGTEGVITLLIGGIQQCMEEASADLPECAGICLGLSCYGENPEADQTIRQALEAALSPAPLLIANDVEVGWAGALGGRPGIHIVSGTGSIAFGKNPHGESTRCGGWSEFFGDEGSCYWIGREAMGLFSKEADGRLPKGPLYQIVRDALGLVDDMEFVTAIQRDWSPYRDRVAAFQKFACQAAQLGDREAIRLYDRAAQELALMVRPLLETLRFTGTVPVTYSGGLFQTGELILTPLARELEVLGCQLLPPERTPVEGALLLAMKTFPAL